VLVLWWYLKGTRLGHSIYAVGSDEERARLNGVGVRRVKVAVYALAGLAAAVGGIVLAATTSTGTPTAGDGYILPSVAAVVIGGTKLTGGRGGVGLTIMGAFILTLINDLVTALHFAPYVSVLAASALLLMVVGGQAVMELRAAKEET
jgi:ribose transport system permease protein